MNQLKGILYKKQKDDILVVMLAFEGSQIVL